MKQYVEVLAGPRRARGRVEVKKDVVGRLRSALAGPRGDRDTKRTRRTHQLRHLVGQHVQPHRHEHHDVHRSRGVRADLIAGRRHRRGQRSRLHRRVSGQLQLRLRDDQVRARRARRDRHRPHQFFPGATVQERLVLRQHHRHRQRSRRRPRPRHRVGHIGRCDIGARNVVHRRHIRRDRHRPQGGRHRGVGGGERPAAPGHGQGESQCGARRQRRGRRHRRGAGVIVERHPARGGGPAIGHVVAPRVARQRRGAGQRHHAPGGRDRPVIGQGVGDGRKGRTRIARQAQIRQRGQFLEHPVGERGNVIARQVKLFQRRGGKERAVEVHHQPVVRQVQHPQRRRPGHHPLGER